MSYGTAPDLESETMAPRKPKSLGFDTLELTSKLKPILPNVYYRSSACMKEIPDGSVHLIVTSPPYNVGKKYASHDDNMDLETYLDTLDRTWHECIRVLCRGGRIAINITGTNRTPYLPLPSFITHRLQRLGMLMRGMIYWNKGASVGTSTAWGSWRSASNPTLRDVGECILVFSKDDYKLHSENKISTIAPSEFVEYTKSIWSFPTVSAKREKHPCPFPEELPSRLIKLYTHLGDTVLDPFLGSGTTAKMAMALGRKGVGYEIDKSYKPLIDRKIKDVKGVDIPIDCFFINGTKLRGLEALYPSINARTSPTKDST